MPDSLGEIPPYVAFKIRPALSAVQGWRQKELPVALAELDAAWVLGRLVHDIEVEAVRAARGLNLSRSTMRGRTYLGNPTFENFSWTDIGNALGITRQSAFDRYARFM